MPGGRSSGHRALCAMWTALYRSTGEGVACALWNGGTLADFRCRRVAVSAYSTPPQMGAWASLETRAG